MQQPESKPKTHGSLEKGLNLLSVFIPDNREMRTVEISNHLSMNRSTVSRMLSVLKQHEFVRQNPENKKYSLGPEINSLALAYRFSFKSSLTDLAKPHLDELRILFDQTVLLEIPSGDRSMVVYVTESLGPIRITARIGDRFHYHSSAGAKCILAFSSDDFINVVLASKLPGLTANTITETATFRRELEKTRTLGFAFENEENSEGISAFAVPVFGKEGLPVAAIVTAGISNKVTWEQRHYFVSELQNTAAKICCLLSGSPADAPSV